MNMNAGSDLDGCPFDFMFFSVFVQNTYDSASNWSVS